MQLTKRLKYVTIAITTAASYEDEAAVIGHHGDNNIAAMSLLRHVVDEVAPPEL
jgi:malate/lactate dehydrogenase